jgi:hypothetical protein
MLDIPKNAVDMLANFQSLSHTTKFVLGSTIVSLILIAVAFFSLRTLDTTGVSAAAKKKITDAKRSVVGIFVMMLISLAAVYKALY